MTVAPYRRVLLKLSGDFQTRVQLKCDRCNEPFEAPAAFHLDEAEQKIA